MNSTLSTELRSYKSIDSISPKRLASIMQWLTQTEVQPGGPYSTHRPIDEALSLNHEIVRLFSTDKNPLSGSLLFLQENGREYRPTLSPEYPSKQHTSTLFATVRNDLEVRCGTHSAPALKVLAKLQSVDASGEISTLSALFSKSMNAQASKADLRHLGIANIYTWLAFSLYDSVYDTASHSARTLIPIANYALQKSVQEYLAVDIGGATTQDLLLQSNLAHLEEMLTCRFDINQPITQSTLPTSKCLKKLLHQRSIAHCLGPLILHAASHPDENTEKIKESLELYCSARQLLDDIHDWQEDIQEGRWSYVTAHLVRSALAAKTIPYEATVEQALPTLKKIFWESEAKKLINNGLRQAEKSKTLIEHLLHPQYSQYFINATLGPILNSYRSSLAQFQDTKEFITLFSKSSAPKVRR